MNSKFNLPNNAHGPELEFLRTEIDTGLTLAGMALDATHQAKIERNRTNARKAYDAILHFMPRARLASEETDEIKSKLEVLRSKLLELGEEL